MSRQYQDNLAFLNNDEFWTNMCSDCTSVKTKAWEGLDSKSRNTFLAIAVRSTHDEQISEDAVQELHLRAHKYRRSLMLCPNRKAWFLRVLRTILIDLAKERRVRMNETHLCQLIEEVAKDERNVSPVTKALNAEEREHFWECFNELTPEMQIALRMFYLEEVGTIEECAERLSLSKEGFRSRLYYGKKELKGRM